jgi:hypothetical protein
MKKWRIELEDLGDKGWSATVEKNHGTEEAPEWWCERSYEGELQFVLNGAKREVRRQEGKNG